MIWFTSDMHFGHANIIEHCKRPFAGIDEMDGRLIENWNACVRRNDTVYHLGDFAWKNADGYRARLSGKLVLVRGSHDRGDLPYIVEVRVEGKLLVLCHYAMRVWPRSHYESWHLYGHSHGRLPGIGFSMDVGVDTNNFFPYSFEMVRAKMWSSPAIR
jgi:calcineurin-like phosphoesterase family protein